MENIKSEEEKLDFFNFILKILCSALKNSSKLAKEEGLKCD